MTSCIACFFATEIEAKALIRNLKIISKIYLKSSTFLFGSFPSNPNLNFLIVKTGIGPKAASEAAQYAFSQYSIREAWIFGLAGGTDQNIPSTTALIATEIGHIDHEKGNWISTDLSLREESIKIVSTLSQKNALGSLLTVKEVIHSKEEKINFGIQKEVIGLEMEAFPIASMAMKAKIPVMEVRFILDSAEDDLPETEKFVEESGKWKPLSTLSALIQHPKMILQLPSFVWKVIQASNTLKLFLKEWIKEKTADQLSKPRPDAIPRIML